METYYAIVEAYPKFESEEFSVYCSAAIGCWVRKDLVDSLERLEQFIGDKILEESPWCPTHFVEVRVLSAEEEQGHELFEQALVDGFAARVHRVEKEVIQPNCVPDDVPFDETWDLYDDFVRRLSRDGGVSFLRADLKQYANGVSPNGGEFLPLWVSRTYAREWLPDFPGHEEEKLSAGELCEWLLPAVDAEDMLIGAGIAEKTIVTLHPLWLRDMIRESNGDTASSRPRG